MSSITKSTETKHVKWLYMAGVGGEWEMAAHGHGISSSGDKNTLKLTVMII